MTLRYVAPAGAPIRAADLGAWAVSLAAATSPLDRLAAAVQARFGVKHCRFTCTGRAGMTVLLRALASLAGPGRDEVLVPAYTCYSVPASAVKAGLRPRLVDVDPRTLDFDLERLDASRFDRALAIVATNLYGLPCDMLRIAEIAKRRGVFLVDDAAQAMGATLGGRPSGSWGDAGLFSLDKGKNVSAIDGGIIVTGSDSIAEALARQLSNLPGPGPIELARSGLKLLAYAAMLRPWLYWIPNAVPQLKLGTTVYTTEFPLERYNQMLGAMAERMLGRLDEFTAARRRNAALLGSALNGVPGVAAVAAHPSAMPAYLRFPLLARDARLRDDLVRRLNAAGIGATGSYPRALADVPELAGLEGVGSSPADGARAVASRIVTLPTHPFVTRGDVRRIGAIVRDTVGREVAAA